MPALPPPQPGFEILVSSQGMSQGLLQTHGVQFFPRALVRLGKVQVGGQWRSIDSPSATGVAGVFVKFGTNAGKWRIDLGSLYRMKTRAGALRQSQAWEFSAGIRRSFGKIGVRAYAEYAPDEFGTGPSLWLETGPSYDLNRLTRVSANVGLRARGGRDYRTLNAGISRTVLNKVTLDARFYATDQAAHGPVYASRLVISARLVL